MKVKTVRIVAKNKLGYAIVNEADMPKGAQLYEERKRKVARKRKVERTSTEVDNNDDTGHDSWFT